MNKKEIMKKAVELVKTMIGDWVAVQQYVEKLETGEFFNTKDDAYRADKKEQLIAAFDKLVAEDNAKAWIEHFGVNYAVTRKEINKRLLTESFANGFLKGRLRDSFIKRMGNFN